MSQTADLERAFASTAAVLGTVEAGQLDASTPCASWKVRDLINHMVGAAEGFANVAEGQDLNTGAETDYASGDFKASYAEQSARAIAAFGADGAMEKTMTMPFGSMPGGVVIGMATTDAFTHGWDLARATGQSTDLDPDLSASLLEQSRQFIQPAFRGENGKAPFGPAVDVPESAPAADQLAGFLGRHV